MTYSRVCHNLGFGELMPLPASQISNWLIYKDITDVLIKKYNKNKYKAAFFSAHFSGLPNRSFAWIWCLAGFHFVSWFGAQTIVYAVL